MRFVSPPLTAWLGGCLGLALTACLLCADPSLLRPSISLSPTGVTALGADATIRCQGQRRDGRFFLHKAGDLNPQRHMDPAGARAEFHIPTMGQQHGGNYSCSYQSRSEPFISSQPSNPVELVVAGSSALMGHSEPGSALGPAEGTPGRGAGTESLWGSPAREEQWPLEIWGRGRGDSSPRCTERVSFPCEIFLCKLSLYVFSRLCLTQNCSLLGVFF
uniref:Ig-like domain-containing protein n=1 Tax=Chelonoidis abingdonii TaxID=106734 RepID=A0A8C0GX90_CHEAB